MAVIGLRNVGQNKVGWNHNAFICKKKYENLGQVCYWLGFLPEVTLKKVFLFIHGVHFHI